MADLMDEAIEISHKLIPCNICGRTFLPSPLKKHAKVCEKNATRKRKTFNSLKQRIEGTELAVFHQKSFLRKNDSVTTHAPQQQQQLQQQQQQLQQQQQQQLQQQQQQQEEKRNQSKWKEKHEQLVQAIRAAKGEKVMAPRRSISAVGSMGTTEQCPSCDRHFGPKAYDRHVEWCKEHKIRASKSPAIVTIAKERLEARTKYRVPPLTKSKRTTTRDKYASPSGPRCIQDGGGGGGGGGGGSSGNLLNVRSTSNLERHTSSKKTKQKNCVPPAEPIIKHNAEKLKSREKEDYDPFIIAEKQLMELLEGDDFKPYKAPSPKNKIQLKSLPTTTTTTQPNFEDDNFEFLENFINDNYTNAKQRKFSDEINSIDPKLINANDNLKLPEPGQLVPDTDHYYSDVDHYSAQYDKSISILEPLILPKTEMKRSHSQMTDFDEFISSAIDDDDDGLPTLKTFLALDLTKQKKSSSISSFGKARNEHNVNKKHPLSPLKRNVSMPAGALANPVVKARSMKNKQDIQDYLHVRHDQKLAAAVAPSRDKLKALSPRPQSSDDLFPIGHDMYNEYKKYEDMYRREQNDHENEDDEVSSNEEQQHLVQQHKQKINADSAYNSLNRKSPKMQQIAPKSRQKVPPPQLKRSPSSSGSETANNNQNNQNTQNNQNQNKNNRLTKFCHECGTKYPLDSAKFCVECGIKRLVL